jgi:methylenetetrahydrofolate reductase (NADPH)
MEETISMDTRDAGTRTGPRAPTRPDAEHTRVELIPLPSVRKHLPALPSGSRISVTCSPTHGLEATLDLTAELMRLGHDVVPHLAARQISTEGELRDLVAACDGLGVREVFVIGGDADHHGPYREALDLAAAYRDASTRVEAFGFAAYPDGHATIDDDRLAAALLRKQDFLRRSGMRGHLSTQMCFDPAVVARWLDHARAEGISLPIHLGVPGRVDRLKLAAISARLGIGSSISFLKKNRTSALKLLGAHFDPGSLVDEVHDRAAHGIDGLHVFSFNNVEPTLAWLDGHHGGPHR